MTEVARDTSGVIRRLHARDVPALVSLRQRAFRHSERRTPEALAAFFRTVFFESPWRDHSLPSLVHQDARGSVTGFLGVVPRRMTLSGHTIRVAVGTQLMVDPHEQGLVGRKLVRAFIEGPQDLSVGDTANDAAQRLWVSVGGHVSRLLSLCWVRRLRPWRHATMRLGSSAAARALRSVASPLASLLDRSMPGAQPAPASRDVSLEPLSAAAMSRELDQVLRAFPLRPSYDAQSLSWLLAIASEKRQFGPLHSAFVRARNGAPLGWFLYHLDETGIASVLQIAARDNAVHDVLRSLERHAWERNAVALNGRAEPWLMDAVVADGPVFMYRGPHVLLHSHKPDLVDMIERGSGYVSRLDGEWWLSF